MKFEERELEPSCFVGLLVYLLSITTLEYLVKPLRCHAFLCLLCTKLPFACGNPCPRNYMDGSI